MKKNLIYSVLAIAAVFAASCAKSNDKESNEDELHYIEAWLKVNHGDAVKTGHGIYILDEKDGNGSSYNGEPYVYVVRTIRTLDGTIISTESEELAKRIGTFKESNYYGPKMVSMQQGTALVGISDMFDGMRAGGERTALIPSWLLTEKKYDNAEEYFKHVPDKNSKTPVIYTIELQQVCPDVNRWETGIFNNFVSKNYPGVTISEGFGHKILKASTGDLEKGSTFYVNYTGRLLNGKVFDTTIEDTAKVYNIWSKSKKYGPVEARNAETDSEVTLGSNKVITGFAHAINCLGKESKIVSFFMSGLGYGANGSASIPPFSPLIFEIEVVDKK